MVGKWIRLWYSIIVSNLQSGVYRFDAKKANLAIKFIENFCRHHEGALAPQLIVMELWQKALVSVLFGIIGQDGVRQFREIVIIIGRKNGKTLLMAAISCYVAFLSSSVDGDYGGRIYYCAPKLEQSRLCYDATYQMIMKEPELAELCKKRRTDIYIEQSNTSLKPLAFSVGKSDGLNISLGVLDEVASWVGDAGLKFYEVLKSSMGARVAPMLVSISTANYVNDGIYDELIKRSTAVLLGSSKETRLAPFLYMIDDVEKWNDINELRKSNPNLGVSVTVDYMLEEIRIAESSLSKKLEFLTKYCNIKQNSVSAFLPYQVVDAVTKKEYKLEDFKNSYCVAGIDLSQTTDLCACAIVVEKDGELYAFAKFFMPANKIDELQEREGVPYRIYEKQGLLQASGENYVDYNDCFNWLVDLVRNYKILPLMIGYDRYSAQYLVQQLNQAGLHTDSVFQGWNLSPVILETDGMLRDGKLQLGQNNLLKSHFLNVALKQNTENRKYQPVKIEQRCHIDGFVAVIDALTVRQKYYDQIGAQLSNKR